MGGRRKGQYPRKTGDDTLENMTGEQLMDTIRQLQERISIMVESDKSRKLIEDKLIDVEVLNKAILDSVPWHIAVLDEEGNIINVNKPWMDFGHSNAAFSGEVPGVGNNYFEICRKATGPCSDEAPYALEGMKSLLRGDSQVFVLEYPCHSPDENRWFMMSVRPLKGEKRGLVVSHIDITARKMAEETANDIRKEAELYVDLMSHDINNLIMMAKGYMEMAFFKLRPEYEAMDDLERSFEAIETIGRLVESIKKIRSLKRGELNYHKVSTLDTIKRAVSGYNRVKDKTIDITISAHDDCIVEANALLEDVFTNIIGNSIKHSGDNVKIDISMKNTIIEGRSHCVVDIKDNGPGIPEEVKEFIFKRGYRGITKASGAGLGLYLVRTLVENFKGTVWVEDRIPGDRSKGSRFIVMLPEAKNRPPSI